MVDKIFKTVGYKGSNQLKFNPYITQCGDITDGVGFQHNNEGWWAISYNDLLQMASLALKERNKSKGR